MSAVGSVGEVRLAEFECLVDLDATDTSPRVFDVGGETVEGYVTLTITADQFFAYPTDRATVEGSDDDTGHAPEPIPRRTGARRHPITVTADRIEVTVERWGHLIDVDTRTAASEVAEALREIVEGHE